MSPPVPAAPGGAERAGQRGQERAPSRGLRVLVGTASAVVALAGIKAAASVIGPVFLALIFTIAASPLRSWLTRRRAPGWVVFCVPLVVVLLVLLALIGALALAVAQLAALLPGYSDKFAELADQLIAKAGEFGVDQGQIDRFVRSFDPGKIFGYVQAFLTGLLGVSSTVLLVVVLLVAMSLDAARFSERVGRLTPDRADLTTALATFARQTGRYLVVSALFGLIVAVLDVGALFLLGVPLPLLWGLLAFITNFIPNIGFVLGVVPPALLGLLESGWLTALGVVVAYSVLNFAVQSLIQPRFLGAAVGLSTSMTLISLLLWAYVLGPLGALLAIPLSSLARALLLDMDPDTRWVSRLISDNGSDAPRRA